MQKIALTLATLPVLAIGMIGAADTAEARGRFGVGFGFQNNWAQRQVFSDRWERKREEPSVTRRQYSEPKTFKRPVQASNPEPEIQLVDEKGRQYDPKAKLWFDGVTSCYSGKQSWNFKDGVWLYGSSVWRKDDGEWVTKAKDAPEAANCAKSPAFLAKVEKYERSKVASADAGKTPVAAKVVEKAPEVVTVGKQIPTSAEITPTVKVVKKPVAAVSAEKNVATTISNLCQKYFPSVGSMLEVPCGE